MSNRLVKRGEVAGVEVRRAQRVASHRRQVQQLDEADLLCVLGSEAQAREVAVVAQAIAAVLRQQKGVMHAMASPEGSAVAVVVQQGRIDRAALDVGGVVRVQANEEDARRERIGPLPGALGEQGVQGRAGV